MSIDASVAQLLEEVISQSLSESLSYLNILLSLNVRTRASRNLSIKAALDFQFVRNNSEVVD
jgi:hypothetical protein